MSSAFVQTEPTRFTLVSRSYCHLCDDMLSDLRALLEPEVAEVVVVDVDSDPALLRQFDELVPVLLDAAGQELCHYHLDTAKVLQYVGRFG